MSAKPKSDPKPDASAVPPDTLASRLETAASTLNALLKDGHTTMTRTMMKSLAADLNDAADAARVMQMASSASSKDALFWRAEAKTAQQAAGVETGPIVPFPWKAKAKV